MKEKPTFEEIEAIVMAEFKYWSGPEVPSEIGISASGAAANIYAAMHGFPAPWHTPMSRKPTGAEETNLEATRLSQNPNA